MPGMWMHALATALTVVHVVLACRHRPRRIATLCGDGVMILLMVDMTVEAETLSAVAWLALSVVTALTIALTQHRRPDASAADEGFGGTWAHGALSLIGSRFPNSSDVKPLPDASVPLTLSGAVHPRKEEAS